MLAALGNESEYRNDELIDDQLRSVLFQVPVAGAPSACLDGSSLPTCFNGVVDLGAIDVERGRDHGIPSYNAVRRAFGLAPETTFTAITGEIDRRPARPRPPIRTCSTSPACATSTAPRWSSTDTVGAASAQRRTTLAARLKLVYGTVDKVDAFTGMLAEGHVLGSDFGELQLAMWKRQFEALRDGDRFFYLNDPALALIERDYGLTARRTLAQVIRDNTGEDVRDDVFRLDGCTRLRPPTRAASAPPCPRRCRSRWARPRRSGRSPRAWRAPTRRARRRPIISTAGEATLTSTTPTLRNGTFALAQPLQVTPSRTSWDAPTSNEAVTIGVRAADLGDRAAAHRRLRGDGDPHVGD